MPVGSAAKPCVGSMDKKFKQMNCAVKNECIVTFMTNFNCMILLNLIRPSKGEMSIGKKIIGIVTRITNTSQIHQQLLEVMRAPKQVKRYVLKRYSFDYQMSRPISYRAIIFDLYQTNSGYRLM